MLVLNRKMSNSLCLQSIALALAAGTELALPALMNESVLALATLAALVVAPPEPPLDMLAGVILHDMVPLLLHDLLLSGRRLLVELWLFGGCLCGLPGKLILVKQGAPTLSWLPFLLPGRAAYVAELNTASTGWNSVVNNWCFET